MNPILAITAPHEWSACSDYWELYSHCNVTLVKNHLCKQSCIGEQSIPMSTRVKGSHWLLQHEHPTMPHITTSLKCHTWKQNWKLGKLRKVSVCTSSKVSWQNWANANTWAPYFLAAISVCPTTRSYVLQQAMTANPESSFLHSLLAQLSKWRLSRCNMGET